MSGLLALLDDVAAIAKLAAAQLDDVAAYTAKAGSKAAGVVVDDTTLVPRYVAGLPAARELPIVWKIARGSLVNKLVILLPAALVLNAFAPWLLTPLLMVGGAYLCFEGAEKVAHLFAPHRLADTPVASTMDAVRLEERRVKGAIKTDFVLSAEITTIALAQIETNSLFVEAVALAAVGVALTALVYGAVALLVKADDIGLALGTTGRLAVTRSLGRAIVRSMPRVMTLIQTIGTAAMLWVGGSILVHGLHTLGFGAPAEAVDHIGAAVQSLGRAAEGLAWVIAAMLHGLIGLAAGLVLIPVVNRLLMPALAGLFPEKAAGDPAN